MTILEEYKISQGTVIGEIRNEIYQKHNSDELATGAQHHWLRIDVSEDVFKIYTLVNSNPVQFLVATVTCPIIDINNTPVMKHLDLPPFFARDEKNPSNLHLEWFEANIPFASRDIIEAQNISYILP
jgi:hypothetical protein